MTVMTVTVTRSPRVGIKQPKRRRWHFPSGVFVVPEAAQGYFGKYGKEKSKNTSSKTKTLRILNSGGMGIFLFTPLVW